MFTGLVEAVGVVEQITMLGAQARVKILIPFAHELVLGESVAVNGCCLTVSELGSSSASFDLLEQTLRVTSLRLCQAGSRVNLERAMRLGGRMGGHLVQGHVDAVGCMEAIETRGQDHVITISLPPEIAALCIEKGSLAVDGISLTIAELKSSQATFWITPHTWLHTYLADAQVGQSVNLEADMIAKMVRNLVAAYVK